MASPSEDLWNGKEKERKVVPPRVDPCRWVSWLSGRALEAWVRDPGFDSQRHHNSFFPFAISKLLDGNSTDCLWSDDHYHAVVVRCTTTACMCTAQVMFNYKLMCYCIWNRKGFVDVAWCDFLFENTSSHAHTNIRLQVSTQTLHVH